jgi:hypothetical protein
MGDYYIVSTQPFEPPSFQHQAIHDLESFVWVLLYLTIILQCTPKEARKFYYTGVGFHSSTMEAKALTKGGFWYMGWHLILFNYLGNVAGGSITDGGFM